MKVLEAGDWSLLLPPEWEAERDGDSILIGDRDGVGCLEISELRRESGVFGAADLEQIRDAGVAWTPADCGSFSGCYGAFEEDDAAVREWLLACEDLLLYLTYSCAADNRGLDDGAVDDLLDTLRFARDDAPESK